MIRYLFQAILLLSCAAFAQEMKTSLKKPEYTVLQAQQQFVEGMRTKNVAVLDRIIAADFVGMGAGGHTAGKSQMLDFHEGPTSFTSVQMERPFIKIFDQSTAVVVGE